MLSHFVIGITDLCAFQIGGNILLKQVVVFAQVTDTAVHKQSRLDNDFIFCEIQRKPDELVSGAVRPPCQVIIKIHDGLIHANRESNWFGKFLDFKFIHSYHPVFIMIQKINKIYAMDMFTNEYKMI